MIIISIYETQMQYVCSTKINDMKKRLFALMVGLLSILSFQDVMAQAWEKETKVISINVGGANYFHVGRIYNGSIYRNYYSPITGELLVQGEFGVHDYVGVGFSAGFGGRAPYTGWGLYGGYGYYGSPEINVPMGVLANFHFYQLIADKTGSDIYAGVSVGSGVAIVNPASSKPAILALAYGGPHAGIRYYFTDKIAVNGEFGYGKTFANAGIVFKL
jgi:hypothetical protein